MELDRHSPLPLHAQVEAYLRELITAPEYRAGACIPHEIGLAKRLGISRNTVRTALEALVRDGLLERRRGIGTQVVQSRMASQRSAWNGFLEEIECQRQISCSVVAVRSEAAPPPVATSLGLAVAATVVHLQRLLSRDQVILAYVESYFHPSLGLTGSEDFRRPLYDIIERERGCIPTVIQEEISAEVVDLPLSRLLKVKRPMAVLVRRRLVADAQRRPLEVATAYYVGERCRRQLEILRDHTR
jgi:GntR family transcriptional regulator